MQKGVDGKVVGFNYHGWSEFGGDEVVSLKPELGEDWKGRNR